MKNRLVYIVLCFLFVFGGAKNNLAAELMEDIEELIVVQGKMGGLTLIVNPPSEYFDANGFLTIPVKVSFYDVKSGQMIFSTISDSNHINLDNFKQGNYSVRVSIGIFYLEEAIEL